MTERTETLSGPYRLATKLAKWENGRTPDDGAPDDVLESSTWYEAGGTEITDPQRIAVLEAANPPEGE